MVFHNGISEAETFKPVAWRSWIPRRLTVENFEMGYFTTIFFRILGYIDRI